MLAGKVEPAFQLVYARPKRQGAGTLHDALRLLGPKPSRQRLGVRRPSAAGARATARSPERVRVQILTD